MKIKLARKMETATSGNRVVKISNHTELRDKFQALLEYVKGLLISRGDHVDALGLAVLTKSNILFSGKHGIAKTMLAETFFKMFTGAKTFKKQFMKGTQLDELFGPMLAHKYRDEGVWEHNIEGMLPTAHFALCDELYRGSESVLPSMMRILNERRFINGGIDLQCPLITAVGTSNFVTDNEELAAFNDRFLIRMDVKPLDDPMDRISMLDGYLERLRSEGVELSKEHMMSLEELEELQSVVRRVPVDRIVMGLYEQTASKFRSQVNNLYVSDRRLCDALKLLQAEAVMKAENVNDLLIGAEAVKPEALVGTQYGLTEWGNTNQNTAFINVLTNVTEVYRQSQEEIENGKKLTSFIDSLEELTKSKDSAKKAHALTRARKAMEQIDRTQPDKMPKTEIGKQEIQRSRDRLSRIVQQIGRDMALE